MEDKCFSTIQFPCTVHQRVLKAVEDHRTVLRVISDHEDVSTRLVGIYIPSSID
jgi:hypothetical protein